MLKKKKVDLNLKIYIKKNNNKCHLEKITIQFEKFEKILIYLYLPKIIT